MFNFNEIVLSVGDFASAVKFLGWSILALAAAVVFAALVRRKSP